MNICSIAPLIVCIALAGCKPKQTSMTVKVHVKTGEGEDVSGAVVSIDGTNIGESNAFGTLNHSFNGEYGTIHRVDVVKENDSYYFAPHFETIKLPKRAVSEWNISATLYMVPKPRPTKANLSQTIDTGPTISAPEKTVTTAEKKTRDDGVWSAYPFLEEDTTVLSTVTLAANDAVPLTQTKKDESTPPVFTVHTYQGREPIGHVDIYSCLPGSIPELLCTSNDRGRCVVRSETLSPTSLSALVVKHPTTKTQILNGPFEKNANVRVSLVAGKTDDYLFLFDDTGPKKPAPDLSVTFAHEPTVTTTSPCGVLSVATSKNSELKSHIRVAHSSVKSSNQELDIDNTQTSAFRSVSVSPVKRRAPRFVVEPVLPGANLTEGDFKQWFEVHSSRHINSDVVRSFKAAGLDAIRLDEFQDLTRSSVKGIAVVQRTVAAWDRDALSLATASHRLRTVIFRSGATLSASLQIYDSTGAQVFAVKHTGLTQIDLIKLATNVVQSFATNLTQSQPPKFDPQNAVAPVGRWLIAKDPTSAVSRKSIDNGSAIVLKGAKGYLDLQVAFAPDALLTAVFEPLSFEEDLVERIYEESAQFNPSQVLLLINNVKKNHPQRRQLDLMAAYLESINSDSGQTHLMAIAHEEAGEEGRESINHHLNRSIALLALAQRDSLPKEDRLKHATEAAQLFDKLLAGTSGLTTDSLPVRTALFYRGQVKAILGDLKNDPMMSMDAEADTREFIRRSNEATTKTPREERLKIAATKTLKSLELQ